MNLVEKDANKYLLVGTIHQVPYLAINAQISILKTKNQCILANDSTRNYKYGKSNNSRTPITCMRLEPGRFFGMKSSTK